MTRYLPYLLLMFSLGALFNSTARAADRDAVQAILQQTEAPEGVVFEIIARQDGLNWAIPRVKAYSEQLRQRFPDLPIAVVSHGREMFALESRQAGKYAELHREVQSLVADEHINVHVCGTYAERRGVSPAAFPDYIDVAAEGPAQIHSYQQLGYRLVTIDRPPVPAP